MSGFYRWEPAILPRRGDVSHQNKLLFLLMLSLLKLEARTDVPWHVSTRREVWVVHTES
jgi:hypothetical protein